MLLSCETVSASGRDVDAAVPPPLCVAHAASITMKATDVATPADERRRVRTTGASIIDDPPPSSGGTRSSRSLEGLQAAAASPDGTRRGSGADTEGAAGALFPLVERQLVAERLHAREHLRRLGARPRPLAG